MLDHHDTAIIASLSDHHGTYEYLCELGGELLLTHHVVGREMFHYHLGLDHDG